jgi:hypothetical protein
MQKLIEIERSIGVETESTTRRRVWETQEYLMRDHPSSEDALRPNSSGNAPQGGFYLLRRLAKAK